MSIREFAKKHGLAVAAIDYDGSCRQLNVTFFRPLNATEAYPEAHPAEIELAMFESGFRIHGPLNHVYMGTPIHRHLISEIMPVDITLVYTAQFGERNVKDA